MLKIDMPKEVLENALDTRAASLRRQVTSTNNKIIKDALQQELDALLRGKTTIAETK